MVPEAFTKWMFKPTKMKKKKKREGKTLSRIHFEMKITTHNLSGPQHYTLTHSQNTQSQLRQNSWNEHRIETSVQWTKWIWIHEIKTHAQAHTDTEWLKSIDRELSNNNGNDNNMNMNQNEEIGVHSLALTVAVWLCMFIENAQITADGDERERCDTLNTRTVQHCCRCGCQLEIWNSSLTHQRQKSNRK